MTKELVMEQTKLLLQLNFSLFYVKLLGIFSALWSGEGIFSTDNSLLKGSNLFLRRPNLFPNRNKHRLPFPLDTPSGAEAVGTSACGAGMSLSWLFHGCSYFSFVSWQNPGGFGEFEWRPVFHVQLINHHCFGVCKWMTSITPCKIPHPISLWVLPLQDLRAENLCFHFSVQSCVFQSTGRCPCPQRPAHCRSHVLRARCDGQLRSYSHMALPWVGLDGADGQKLGPSAWVWRGVKVLQRY